MCGTVSKVANGFDKFVKSDAGWALPMVKGPAMLMEKATGLRPSQQYTAGAAIGTGVAAAGAAGLGAGSAAIGGSGPATAGINGTTAALGQGGAGVMAQSGGVPLLTKVLLGTSVATTLAGYFGRKSPEDYSQWFNGLNAEDQQSVKDLENQLTELQSNTELRNQAVQKVTADFPNVVSQVAPEVIKAKQAAGEEFDAASKQYLDYALNAASAKAAANGGISSGAANEAAAKVGAGLGLDRLKYQTDRGDQALEINRQGWQARLTEVESLRNFQQQMMGMGSQQRFTAAQASLAARRNTTLGLAGISQQQKAADDQSTGQLFGSLGSTLGTAAMLPMYQQLFNPNKAMALPNAGPSALPTPRLNTAGVGGYKGGY